MSVELCKSDPTQGIKLAREPKSDGIYTWSEEEIAAYEAAHPIGTKARLALALLLILHRATTQRYYSDGSAQHIRDGISKCGKRRRGQFTISSSARLRPSSTRRRANILLSSPPEVGRSVECGMFRSRVSCNGATLRDSEGMQSAHGLAQGGLSSTR